MTYQQIVSQLRKALLHNGRMELGLYEYELKEHIDYWYEGLKADGDEFVFVVTENSGDVAMALITVDKTVYINEKAREKLSQLWSKTYSKNIKRLLPMIADNVANNIISVNGVKTQALPSLNATKRRQRAWIYCASKSSNSFSSKAVR